ncbi:hypothetical protein AVEN_50789-1 [Araneus ventricosus]|uniref:Mos1 transposase HTH domain-containing protein n=1 Tax=Araneus ventricosus TaxID=182803 RepID=A0A4Y2SIA0_ARAVE|nr:hypothetical protein AVEN_50789-1 [Araneus ventricosus]
MFRTIDRPSGCEIRAVIKFLNTRNVRSCEIYRQVSESRTDLAPSDFHLFSHLKKFLADQQFARDDEIKLKVQNWFSSVMCSSEQDCTQHGTGLMGPWEHGLKVHRNVIVGPKVHRLMF